MKACVFTLGCKMNEVESASLMSGLEELGYQTTDIPEYADVYLINTCAVTAEAEKKSRQAIARLRKFNQTAPVIVFGCAAEHSKSDFEARDGVLFVFGAQAKDRVLAQFKAGLSARVDHLHCSDEIFCELPDPKRVKTRAFVRIQDGCNHFCSYCIIPYLRGRTRSRSSESILAEARSCGAKEIVLTGIDISSYRSGGDGLGGLLKKLGALDLRVRLGSVEAGLITREFLRQAKEAGNVAPHFHLSLQSGSNADIIVGFPSETEADFIESLSIIGSAKFAHVHCFPYSPRKGTVAYRMKDLPAEVKRERMGRILKVAGDAEETYLARFAGRTLTALFEEDGGYTENYIRVYSEGAREGELARVRLVKRERDGFFAERIEV